MAQQDSVASAKSDDLQVYQSLREYEEHFNRTQVEVKKLASAWMLATFAAIAFIVRGDLAKQSLLDSGSLLVLIGLAGNIGLLSLWILDQQVNQRLLGAAFRVGMLLERSNPALPPIRSKMWLNSRSHGMGRFHSFFYACPMAFNLGAQIYGLTESPPGNLRWLFAASAVGAAIFLWPFGKWLVACFERPSTDESRIIEQTVANWEQKRQGHDDLPDQA